MSRNLSVTEPHPTVPKSGAYILSGRGGAGNIKRYKPEEVTTGPNATGPPSRVSLSRPLKRTFTAGRGGAGNMVSADSDSIFQFDEEMIKKRETQAAPVYHIGRGGAGNLFSSHKPSSSSRKDSIESNSSTESERVAALRRDSGGVMSIFGRRSA